MNIVKIILSDYMVFCIIILSCSLANYSLADTTGMDPVAAELIRINTANFGPKETTDSSRQAYRDLRAILDSHPDSIYYDRVLTELFGYAIRGELYKEAIEEYENIISRNIHEHYPYSGINYKASVTVAYLETGRYEKAIEIWRTIWEQTKNRENPDPWEIARCMHMANSWIWRAMEKKIYEWIYLLPLADVSRDSAILSHLPEESKDVLISSIIHNMVMAIIRSYYIMDNILSMEERFLYPAGTITGREMLDRLFAVREHIEPEYITIAVQISGIDWEKINIDKYQHQHQYLPLISKNIWALMTAESPKEYVTQMAAILMEHWSKTNIHQNTNEVVDGLRYTAQLADIGLLSVNEMTEIILRATHVIGQNIRYSTDEQLSLIIQSENIIQRIEFALREDRNRIQSTLDILGAAQLTP